MARSINEIYDSLNQVKGNMAELGVYVNNDSESIDTAKKLVNDVRTGSRVAIWRLWLWIVAVSSWMIEKIQDKHMADITALLESDKPHTLRWYAEQSKLWQYGYELEWLGYNFGYSVIDESARIVKYAAAQANNDGTIIIKVMKANKTPLTIEELTAFSSFWEQYKDAGVTIQYRSTNVNQTWFTAHVYRNRNIVNADNTLIANPQVNVVTDPANAYLQSVAFNGVIYYLQLIQAIMDQPGIKNVVLTVASVDDGLWGSAGAWTLIPSSGFAEINWDLCSLTYHDVYE